MARVHVTPRIFQYVLKQDRALPENERSVFTLKKPSFRQGMELAMNTETRKVVVDGEAVMRDGRPLEVVRKVDPGVLESCLVSNILRIENYVMVLDGAARAAAWDENTPVERRRAVLDDMPIEHQFELAMALYEAVAGLGAEAEKNSDGRSGPATST